MWQLDGNKAARFEVECERKRMSAVSVVEGSGMATKASRNRKPRSPKSIAEWDKRTTELDRRSVEFKRYDTLRIVLINDKGGEAFVTIAEAQIIDRAAFVGMQLEMMQVNALAGNEINLDAYQRASNTQRRLLESIGLERRAKDITPTLEEHLRRKAAERVSAAPIAFEKPSDDGAQE